MSVLSTIPSTNLRWCDLRDTLNANGGLVTNFFQDAFCDGSVEVNSPVPAANYGECTTAAETAEKSVSISGITSLTSGMLVHVKFTNTNTASSPTVNINSLGAKAITTTDMLDNSHYFSFRYNGTSFAMCGKRSLTYYPNANVNIWSAFKPMPYNSLTPLTGTQQDATGRGIEVKRVPTSGNWTDITGGYSTIQAMFDDFVANPNDTIKWIWRKPSGGATEPFRIGDYKGYYPSAQTFLKNPHPSSNIYRINQQGKIIVGDYVVRSLDANSINPYTAGSKMTIGNSNRELILSSFYLGVMAVNLAKTNILFCVTNDAVIGTVSAQGLNAATSVVSDGCYFVYFLSSVFMEYGAGIPSQSGIFLPVPGNFGSLGSVINENNRFVTVFVYVDDLLYPDFDATEFSFNYGSSTVVKKLSQATLIRDSGVQKSGMTAYAFTYMEFDSSITSVQFDAYAEGQEVSGHTIRIEEDDDMPSTWQGMTCRSTLESDIRTQGATFASTEFEDDSSLDYNMLFATKIMCI